MATAAGKSELFSPAEMAFLAKEEPIQIMPKIRLDELQFLHVRPNRSSYLCFLWLAQSHGHTE